jgi:general secretion pathway protein K
MIRLLTNQRGMALLLTILLVSLMVAVTMGFNTSSRQDLYDAANLRDGVKLGYTAKSALNLAREVLSLDAHESNHDSLHETWAQLPALSSYSSALLGGQRVELAVVDHSGRIQVNALVNATNPQAVEAQRGLLERFLLSEEFELSKDEVEEILAALQDWLDSDDEVSGLGGAEDAYYRSLDPPYACGNAPMEFIEELLLVKGISRELFYGKEDRPGLRDYLTTYGKDGKININTADPMVLRALADRLDTKLAEAMVAYRQDKGNDLSDSAWYKQVSEFPGDIEIAPGLRTARSVFFEIRAVAFLGTMSRQADGVVQRSESGSQSLVAWRLD